MAHRKVIADNLIKLSDDTVLSTRILDELVARRIITKDERTKIVRKGHLDDYETKSYFYDQVLKLKDSEGFRKYIELDQEEATLQSTDVLEILKKGLEGSKQSAAKIVRPLPKFNFANKTRQDGTSYRDIPFEFNQTSTAFTSQKYPVRPEVGARFALIVNIIEFDTQDQRCGADKDTVALASALEALDFDVSEIQGRITLQELQTKISLFKNMCKNGDVAIVAFMSHGSNDLIATSDGVALRITSDVLAQFNNVNFEEFIGKPKIFFFQACRGRVMDQGVSTKKDTFTKHTSSQKIPSWTDMLVCYGTMEGQYSYRETKKGEEGSWFIQVLSEKLKTHGKTLDITKILCQVAEQMKEEEGYSGEKQMCPWTNIGFTKEFYF